MLFKLSQLGREMVSFQLSYDREDSFSTQVGVGTFVAGMPHTSSSTTGTGHNNAAELRNKERKDAQCLSGDRNARGSR